VLAAAAGVLLAGLAAGSAGAIVAAAVIVAYAGYALRTGYGAAPPAVLDLPESPAGPTRTVRRLERISGQLSIGMTDGLYFDRAVRPLLARIAAGIGSTGALAERSGGPPRPPTLSELNELVERMEHP
jgi:hypothetical protein